jgi:hypothetical protein
MSSLQNLNDAFLATAKEVIFRHSADCLDKSKEIDMYCSPNILNHLTNIHTRHLCVNNVYTKASDNEHVNYNETKCNPLVFDMIADKEVSEFDLISDTEIKFIKNTPSQRIHFRSNLIYSNIHVISNRQLTNKPSIQIDEHLYKYATEHKISDDQYIYYFDLGYKYLPVCYTGFSINCGDLDNYILIFNKHEFVHSEKLREISKKYYYDSVNGKRIYCDGLCTDVTDIDDIHKTN